MQRKMNVIGMGDERFEGLIFTWNGSEVVAIEQWYDNRKMLESGEPYQTKTLGGIQLKNFDENWIDEMIDRATFIKEEESSLESLSIIPTTAIDKVLARQIMAR